MSVKLAANSAAKPEHTFMLNKIENIYVSGISNFQTDLTLTYPMVTLQNHHFSCNFSTLSYTEHTSILNKMETNTYFRYSFDLEIVDICYIGLSDFQTDLTPAYPMVTLQNHHFHVILPLYSNSTPILSFIFSY